MEYSKEDKLEWTMIFIHEFGKRFGLTMKEAFGYLSRFKGIDFIDKWLCTYAIVRKYGRRHRQSVQKNGRTVRMRLYHGTSNRN